MQWSCAIYCIRDIQNSDIFSTLFFEVYAAIFNGIQRYWNIFNGIQRYWSIFNGIQHYWNIFTHIQTLLRHNLAYSSIFLCVTLAYLQPCQILSHSIFRTRGLFKSLWNVDQTYSESCHWALFSHIQGYSQPCGTLAYGETGHIRNPEIFRTFP